MAKAANDEGLPEGFEYMDPPPGWPPARSAEELKRMALRLQEHLERETRMGRAGDPVLRKGGEAGELICRLLV